MNHDRATRPLDRDCRGCVELWFFFFFEELPRRIETLGIGLLTASLGINHAELYHRRNPFFAHPSKVVCCRIMGSLLQCCRPRSYVQKTISPSALTSEDTHSWSHGVILKETPKIRPARRFIV